MHQNGKIAKSHRRIIAKSQIRIIAKSQHRKIAKLAALAITGAWQGSCRSKLYKELGLESLSDRRWCRRILQIHKIVSDKTPSYLKNKLPRLRRPLYRQSNSNTFHELKCKSLRYMSSSFPGALLGAMLLLILMILHLSVFLKTISYLIFHSPMILNSLRMRN